MFIAVIAFNRLLIYNTSINLVCSFSKTVNYKGNEPTLAEAENGPLEPILSLFHSKRWLTTPTNAVFPSSIVIGF